MITRQLIEQVRLILDVLETSLEPSPELLKEVFKDGDDLYANLDGSKSSIQWSGQEDIVLAKALRGLVKREGKDHAPKLREIIAVRLVKSKQLERTEKAVINRIHSAMKSYYGVGPETTKPINEERVKYVLFHVNIS